jgi:hypothetical protein
MPPGDVEITAAVSPPGTEGSWHTFRVVEDPAGEGEVGVQRGAGRGWASTSALVQPAGDEHDLGDAVRVETVLTVGGRAVASCSEPSVPLGDATP